MSVSVFMLIDPVDKIKPPAFACKAKADDVCAEMNQILRDRHELRGNYWRVRECLVMDANEERDT